MNDIYEQQIQGEVENNNSHFNFYRIIRKSPYFEFHKYLTSLHVQERIILCKFRCGNHRLPIVTCRYEGVAHCDRNCTLCTKNDLGEEFHFLFICDHFSNEWKKYTGPYFYNKPNTYKAIRAMRIDLRAI